MLATDVAVIGAGPAGCSCAIALRQLGLSVAVISASGKAKTPTETVVPALRQVLQSLKATSALRACEPCYGISSSWGRKVPGLAPSIVNPHGHAWFVHRENFDRELQASARGAGANWIEALAEMVFFENAGVLISTAAGEVQARFVAIAAGSSNWATRFVGQERQNCDQMIALWSSLGAALESRLLFTEPADYGWWYVCPDHANGSMACLVTDAEIARIRRVTEPANWMEHFCATNLSKELRLTETANDIQAASIGFSFLKLRHGSRWIAIGDAGVKLDPLGSCGLMTALDSGRRAARAIADHFRGDSSAFNQYERWTADLIRVFGRQRHQQYSMEQSKRPGEFWARRLRQTGLHAQRSTTRRYFARRLAFR